MDFPVYSITFLGMRIHAYGMVLALGAAVALLTLKMGEKRHGMRPGSAPLMLLLGGLLGLLLSRLVFSLVNYNRLFFDAMEGSWLGLRPFFHVGDGGLSMFGFLFGWLLAGALFARATRRNISSAMDWLALPTALFIAIARFGEILGGMGYGEEMPEGLQFFPLAVMNRFEEWYLAVFMLEGASALLIAAQLWHAAESGGKTRPALPGASMLRMLIPFAALQIFFESLRQDAYLRLESNAFIRVGQLFGVIVLVSVLFLLGAHAVRVKRQRAVLPALLSLLLAALCAAAAEFNEKLPVPRALLYALSLLTLCIHAAAALRLLRGIEASHL